VATPWAFEHIQQWQHAAAIAYVHGGMPALAASGISRGPGVGCAGVAACASQCSPNTLHCGSLPPLVFLCGAICDGISFYFPGNMSMTSTDFAPQQLPAFPPPLPCFYTALQAPGTRSLGSVAGSVMLTGDQQGRVRVFQWKPPAVPGA
jgi:hypothetical protein